MRRLLVMEEHMISRACSQFKSLRWASPRVSRCKRGVLGCTDPSGWCTASTFHTFEPQLSYN